MTDTGHTAKSMLVTTVTWDQHLTGVLVGNYFIDHLKKEGITKPELLNLQTLFLHHCQERFVGLHEVFDKAKKKTVLKSNWLAQDTILKVTVN